MLDTRVASTDTARIETLRKTAALKTTHTNLKTPSSGKNDSYVTPVFFPKKHVYDCNRTEECGQSSNRAINFQVSNSWCQTKLLSTVKLALRPSPQAFYLRHRTGKSMGHGKRGQRKTRGKKENTDFFNLFFLVKSDTTKEANH